MPLAPGTWLGQYEIREHLGSGGMGEVYRAHDNKLKREVALKVLPPHFARDPERIARFRREAQLLAQLNHPNIAILYNFEETGETRFLVMELVLGETLRERIKRGALPLEESLDICEQICEALEHAHEKPIIHRDLKPANVKVTPEGQVKVLDFGLAKAFGADKAAIDPHDAPTGSLGGTLQGTILGTPAYMSPEQARGKETDKRTDIWALGCVLYELLTGQWAFQSRHQSPDPRQAGAGRKGGGQEVPPDTVQDIIAKVLEREPDWTALPETTPPWLRSLLRRCLEKDLKRRFRDAADIRIAIEESRSTVPAPIAAPVAVPPGVHLSRHQAAMVGLAALALAAILSIATWYLKPAPIPTSQAPAHLTIALPPGDRLAARDYPPVAFSPDGSNLVYVAIHNGVQQLFLRALDSREAKPFPGTEGGASPFFSPDSQWIGFFAGGKLKKVSIAGGAPQTLCDSSGNGGGSWGTDGTIVFASSYGSGLLRVSAAGGTPKVLTTLDPAQGEVSHRWPQFLPGSKALLFTVMTGRGWDEWHTAVLRLDTGKRRIVLRGGHTGRFVPTGHLVYYRAGTLLVAPFDLARLEVTSSAPVTIAEGVKQSESTVGAEYSFSSVDSLAYVPASPRQFERRLVWVDRKGEVELLPAPPRSYDTLALAPDGRQVAVGIRSDTEDVWIYDLARGTLTRLTSEAGGSQGATWTPDGKRIAYMGFRGGFRNLFWRPADGTGAEERLTTGENAQYPASWSPDGKWLAFDDQSPTTGEDIWMLRLDGGPGPPALPARRDGVRAEARKSEPLIRTPFNEYTAVFSPDGRWLAYASDESGRQEVYVQPFPGPGRKWQISTEGGGGDSNPPHWARNGRELFYANGNKMMVVDIQTQPTFTAGKPRLLFEGQYGDWWDVAPDGQRFLKVQAVEPEQPATQIHVVLNWFEELRRKVPAAR